MLDFVRRLLPPSVFAALRWLNRLRWITKYRIVRRNGQTLAANRMLGLRHVLFDPEVESYTYDIANETELAAQLARIFAVTTDQATAYIQETHEDRDLNENLQRRVRWRVATKQRLPLGNRAIWYVIVRLQKPPVVVETGILSGLGSIALLRAIERNAEEGHDGRLISADTDPAAGWLVPYHLRHRWTKLVGISTEVLPEALQHHAVGVFIQDSPHTYDNQHAEFSLALKHADDPIVLVDSGGGQSSALEEICSAHGVKRHLLKPQPVRHIYNPSSTDIAVIADPAR